MSIEENNNELEKEEAEAIEEAEAEEQSTIFAAPEEKERTVKTKNKKRNILAAISAILALSLVIFAVVKFVPVLTDDDDEVISKDIAVTAYDQDDVSKVTVKNESGEYTYYSEVELTEIDGESKRYVYWYIDSVAKRLADTEKIGDLVYDLANFKAVREMGEDQGIYGLDKPTYTVNVYSRDNAFEDFTITVGNPSPDKAGAYVKLSNNTKVYLADNDILDQFKNKPTDYADTTAVKAVEKNSGNSAYFENDTLVSCDYITLINPNFSTPIKIIPNDIEGSKTYAAFRVVKPTERFADNVTDLLNIAKNGLVGDGVYVFNPTDADIKAYKLDNPEAVMEIKIGETLISLKAAKVDADYYALIDQDKEAIYKVYYNSLSFATSQMSRYFNKFLTMEMLPNLDKVTISHDNKTHEFSITYYEEKEDGEDFDIILNGTELEQKNFQNYYQVFLSLEVIDYNSYTPSSAPVYTFKMEHVDKSIKDTTLKLYKYTDQRYIAEVDGNPMGLVSSTAYNKLTSYLEKLLNNEEVPKS